VEKPVSKYISIEGVIGAGKTTLARALSKHLKSNLILEAFEENPFLKKFYEEPGRFAFQTQLFFLTNRYTQLRQFNNYNLFYDYLITDYSFDKDDIFARLTLSDDEYKIYRIVFQPLREKLSTPDLVVYLQSTPERLMKNIARRNRPYEKLITKRYIEDLNKAYNQFYASYKKSPLLIINVSNLDFVSNPEDFELIVSLICNRKHNVGVEYFNPEKDLGY